MARLKRYIEEAIRLQDRAARRMAMAEIDKAVDFFSKKNWDMPTELLGALLNIIYKKHGVTFTLASPEEDAYSREDFNYVTAGQTLVDGTIRVFVSGRAGKVLAQDMKDKENDRAAFENSQFFKELISVLSHELVHREQWKRAGEKWIRKAEKGKIVSIPKYLSSKVEMTAWAHDAALSFIGGEDKPNEIQIYKEFFGIKHPVFKRFMKRFYGFIKEFQKRES
jgi:hypothetical protein